MDKPICLFISQSSDEQMTIKIMIINKLYGK